MYVEISFYGIVYGLFFCVNVADNRNFPIALCESLIQIKFIKIVQRFRSCYYVRGTEADMTST
jgi:hypothetical protein